MEWPTKILKDSSHKGRYHGRFRDDRTWAESHYSNDGSSGFDREEIDCAIALSLSEVDQKGNKVIDEEDDYERYVIAQLEEEERQARAQEEKDELRARAQQEEDERRVRAQREEDERRAKAQLEEDEQLAKAIKEILSVQSPPRYDNSNIFQPFLFFNPSGNRICTGCNTEIGHGQGVSRKGAVWHPECFRCCACNLPITDTEFLTSRKRPYHKYCYKEQLPPKCYVCHNFIPTNSDGLIEYRTHPFWRHKYCPSHERDGTPRCCSCERMEGHHLLPETRGLCLSEGQTVTRVLRRPRISSGYQLIDMMTEPCRLIRQCEVTAILILYGLPRLLTGSILAHEMMHAWLRFNGYPNLRPAVEEGICQVLAHMWLESKISSGFGSDVASSSLSSPSHSDIQKELGTLFKHLIELDTSSAYGDGFRQANKAVKKYGLIKTLEHIQMTRRFPL